MDSKELLKKNESNATTYQSEGETQGLCAKGCGFFGNSATHNLCSKCYNDYLKEQCAKIAESLDVKLSLNSTDSIDNSAANTFPCAVSHDSATTSTPTPTPTRTQKNKCKRCNKKVGLTGFACRCGGMFCGMHRYPEEHSCSFDFKTAGRVALAKDNPLCMADKLQSRV